VLNSCSEVASELHMVFLKPPGTVVGSDNRKFIG
jgi:hypothetical protein